MGILKINGTVDRIFMNGKCVKVVEKSTSGDKEYTQRYTAWFEDAPGLSDGQPVAISGFISVKQGQPWTDRDGNERTSIDVNINKAKLDTKGDVQQAAPAADTAAAAFPAPDVWNAPHDDADGIPF